MSDDNNDLPGFIDDGPSRPKSFGPPGESPPTPPPDAAEDGGNDDSGPIDPFAGTTVRADPTAPPPNQAPAAPPTQAAADGPVDPFAGTAVTADPIAASQTPVEGEDAEGPRKDLWACPHCDAKNKPDRGTCRSCGKAPDEAKAPPIFLRPPALIGVSVVILVLVLITLFTGDPSFELVQPGPQTVTDDLLTGGDTGAPHDLGEGLRFVPSARVVGVGRVLHVSRPHSSVANAVRVVLLFGPDTTDDRLAQLRYDPDRNDVYQGPATARVDFAIVHLLDPNGDLPAIGPGQWLALSGERGTIPEADWATTDELGRFGHVVLPTVGVRVTDN